jgi:hypothetical protein
MAKPDDENEPEIRYVNPKDLRLGPIRRESLSDKQLGILRAIFEVISPYQDMAFETNGPVSREAGGTDAKRVAVSAQRSTANRRESGLQCGPGFVLRDAQFDGQNGNGARRTTLRC